MEKLAIVILNWNGKNLLEKFLPSVVQFSDQHPIFVIDNQSSDDSIDFLKRNYPQIKIVQNGDNLGFAEGYNKGLKSIDAEIYCLLNSDVEVTENWTKPILQLLDQNPDVAVVQPKILSYHQKNKFEFAGAGGGLMDNLGYPYCRGRVVDDVEDDHGQYNDECQIFWASGCAFFIRSQDFWQQNGFDQRFFAHQEEIDLCWRLQNVGRKIYYTGKATVYHVGGETLNKHNSKKTLLNFRNNLTMLLKNLPFPEVIFVLVIRLFLDGVAGIHLWKTLGFSHLWAVVKAHFQFYAQIPKTVTLRQKHQIKNYYQSKWMIFRHFINK